MVKGLRGVSKDSATDSECQHRWAIGIASGPISTGKCKVCGTHKEFKNYPSDHMNIEGEFKLSIGKHNSDKLGDNSDKRAQAQVEIEKPELSRTSE